MAVYPPSAPAPAPAAKIAGLERPMPIVGPQFCVPYDVELVMTEKVISLDDASCDVKDSNGNVVLKLKGRFWGLHQKRWLCDPNGARLLTVQEKFRTAHTRWNMYRGDSTDEKDLICTIKTPKVFQWRPEYHVFFAGNTSDEKHCNLRVKRGYNHSQMFFYLGETDRIIAQLNERKNIKTSLLGQDSYGMTVNVNMDYAFVVAMATILDAIGDAEAASAASAASAANAASAAAVFS